MPLKTGHRSTCDETKTPPELQPEGEPGPAAVPLIDLGRKMLADRKAAEDSAAQAKIATAESSAEFNKALKAAGYTARRNAVFPLEGKLYRHGPQGVVEVKMPTVG